MKEWAESDWCLVGGPAAIVIQAWWRAVLARRRAQRRRQAANTIRRYLLGEMSCSGCHQQGAGFLS